MCASANKDDPTKRIDYAIAQTSACLLELSAIKMEIEKAKLKLVRIK
jgi:hypothetical protein